jgi:hypothetical protein
LPVQQILKFVFKNEAILTCRRVSLFKIRLIAKKKFRTKSSNKILETLWAPKYVVSATLLLFRLQLKKRKKINKTDLEPQLEPVMVLNNDKKYQKYYQYQQTL